MVYSTLYCFYDRFAQMQTHHPLEKDPQSLETILEARGSLQTIRLKTAQIQQAQHILTQILPAKILAHCFVGHIDQQKITLFTDNAVWATQLRYQQSDILTQFRQNTGFRGLNRVKIKISTSAAVKVKPAPKQALSLSSKVTRLLEGSAKSITNPILKKALLKLADNSRL